MNKRKDDIEGGNLSKYFPTSFDHLQWVMEQ